MAEVDRENPARSAPSGSPWRERALLFVVSGGAFAASIAHARPSSDATHDAAIVRVIGLGFVGMWRALDVFLAAPLLALPWSTSIHRAEIASALGAATAAGILYRLTRNLLERCVSMSSQAPSGAVTWLGAFVAAIATWATVLGTAWQCEAASPGGATWGGLLPFIFPLILAEKYVQNARFAIGAVACGLAFSYEPLLGASALASAATFLAMTRTRPSTRELVQTAVAFSAGLAGPVAFALSRRSVSPLSLPLASPLAG